MRLTTFTDYSLRVLIYLAMDPGRRATIGEVATAFGVSENHLMKVVYFLGQKRFLKNVRGKGGGMTLARAPEAINIGEVVRLTEADMLPAECFDRRTNTCVITPVCQLRGLLGKAVEAFHGVLDTYTLADLVREPKGLARILAPQGPGSEAILQRMPKPRSRRLD